MESDGCGCEGRKGRWNFQLFLGHHKSFTHKKYFKGGKFSFAISEEFDTMYSLSPNFLTAARLMSLSFFNFLK